MQQSPPTISEIGIEKASPQTNSQHQGNFIPETQNYYTGFEKRIFDISMEITTYGQSLIDSNTILLITSTVVDPKFPSFLRLIINIFLHLIRCFSNGNKHSQQLANDLQKQPQKITLKKSVWEVILEIIRKKLYSCQSIGYCLQLSSMIFFRKQLVSMVFYLISQPETFIKIQSIIKFCQTLQALQSCLPNHLYHMLGGERILTTKIFNNSLKNIIEFISNYLNADNIVIQFVKSITEKKKNKDNQILQSYVTIVSDFRKTNNIQFLANVQKQLFGAYQSLNQGQFMERLKRFTYPKQKYQSNIFTKLYELIKLEFYIVETDKFKTFSETNKVQNGKSKYYIQTLEKLMNKCPYNGDERCDCKKCQCVRRNRQSANKSQQKKRQAFEQIGPLNQKLMLLEQKNYELQAENMYLKNIIASFYQHPNFYTVIKQNVEPLSNTLIN